MTTDSDKPYRGRRISWQEFWRQHPHLKPKADNDNDDKSKEEKKKCKS